MSGDTKRVLEVNQIDNLQGSTQRVKQETTLNNLRGITQRVFVVGGGGSTPVIDELNVTPSTSAQTITAPEGVDGYSPVNVAAVTSAIDANITAENIKKDVEILGVTGSYEGQTPTGTMYIISNGTYNVADKAIANVQVPTTAPAHYVEKAVDANGKLVSSTNMIDLTGVTDVGNYVLAYSYYQASFPANTNVDLSNITTISGTYACWETFAYASGIVSADLSGLTTVSGNNACNMMFAYSSITSINVSNLTTLSGGYAFTAVCRNCSGLTSVVFSKLNEVTGSNCLSETFRNCTNLTSLSFPALKSTSFDSRTNQFSNIVQGVTGCTIHFPSNLDPAGGSTVISSLSGYPNFGGTNTILAFDLPATE